MCRGKALKDGMTIGEDTTTEMTLRLQGGLKSDESMTSAGIAEDRQVKRKSSEPFSEINGFDEVKLSDVTAHIESASRRSDARIEDTVKGVEVIMKQTTDTVLQSVSAKSMEKTQRSMK